jgi:cellulose 1,4-beta-cellobiosidase
VAGAAALAAVIVGTSIPAVMTVISTPAAPKLCHLQSAPVAGGMYRVQNNEWNSTASECITTEGSADFTVANSSISRPGGAPGGYPSIYKGCHWGVCTTRSGLPIQVSSLMPGMVTTSWSTTQTAGGAYNAVYDIWFSWTPTASGRPNGAELMVWLNHHGSVRQPFGFLVGAATVGGHAYNVWFWNQGWNTISYSMTRGTTSVSGLDIGELAADAVRRGYIQDSWYLIDVEAGFELWQGGAGLATNSFSVKVSGASGKVP